MRTVVVLGRNDDVDMSDVGIANVICSGIGCEMDCYGDFLQPMGTLYFLY